jgi:outer membrane protein OmpA-like peptidoglycan-associated protein
MKAERDSLAGEIAAVAGEIEKGGARERALQAELTGFEDRRERLRRVKNLFAPGEAVILRQDGRLILRMKGIVFSPAKSELLPESLPLLAKVLQAIRDLPGAGLTVEGHTDSKGEDAKNLALSEERALAVRTHLESNLDLTDRIVRSTGYGEGRPVATNDTEEGRAENRRIEFVFEAPALIGE